MLKKLSSLFIVVVSLFALWHSDMRTTAIDFLARTARTVEAWEMERLIQAARSAKAERAEIAQERDALRESLEVVGSGPAAQQLQNRIDDLTARDTLSTVEQGDANRRIDALSEPHRDALARRTAGLGYFPEGGIVLVQVETTRDGSAIRESEMNIADKPVGPIPAIVEQVEPTNVESPAGSEKERVARPSYEPPVETTRTAPCQTVTIKQITPARASKKYYSCK